ncbi:hypothetical protein Sste5346_001964 [Sporothrix stenoceras]|uniref:INO80 complex subunit B-like conserved region domain-containing protein n=1 Tax=Sporothrix stenoceras TaxID=5173 RepID=A0ABR3ZJL3_9PEZI
MADNSIAMSSRSRRGGDSRATARAPSADSNLSTVRVSGSAKRQKKSGGSGRDRFESHDVINTRRPTRGPKKRYVESESSEDEDAEGDDDDEEDEEEEEEEEEKDEIRVGASDVDMDAEGEAEDMDIDAEGDADDLGEEDAEGDIDMDTVPGIKVSKPSRSTGGSNTKAKADAPAADGKAATSSNNKKAAAGSSSGRKRGGADEDEDDEEEDEEEEDDDDDDEELSEAEGLPEGEINDSVEVAGEEDAEGEDDDEANVEGETEMMGGDDEEDAEGDEDDEEDAEGDEDDEEDAEGDSDGEDGDGSRAGTPDLTKMTRRQRARFEETPQEYMKLSDEVQVKKVFTAEELSMRRQEMARRRRNLSDKRNEEVKAETINKLLKRQAPKTTKKNAQAEDEEGAVDGSGRSAAVFIRWTSNKQGNRVGVKNEVLGGPVGALFGPPSAANSRQAPPKMVEEVS